MNSIVKTDIQYTKQIVYDDTISLTDDTLTEDTISLTDDTYDLYESDNYEDSEINVLDEFEKLSLDSDLCINCFINPKNIQFIPCNHIEYCYKCSKNMKNCEICEEQINEKINLTESPDNNKKLKKCTICSSIKLSTDYNYGHIICIDCGNINEKLLECGAEWKFYRSDNSASKDPSRCGCPTNVYLPKSSLGTMIAAKNTNLVRIHQWNSMPYHERSLREVHKEIELRCAKNNLPKSIIDDAKFYYYKIHNSKVITRGAIRKGIQASCVLIACQKRKISVVPNDIAKYFDINSKDLTRGCKRFYKLIGNIDVINEIENLRSCDYIERYCKKLEMSQQYIEIAKIVSENTDKSLISSENTPPSIAAGSILLICLEYDLQIPKKNIAAACNITEVTIIKTYRKMIPYKEQLLPSKKVINEFNITTNFEDKHKVKLYSI